ncbi:LPS export ABC transporter ATP-binding protein [Candidatus Aerophobetes bacterium]|uniref:LPS export ABC transporter ATP-binding protein n=1 Tax=Aerophobetes bacterium TaxID=2030807 RepID=A0A662D8H7_UNCAE|nr:MAG: LPS export ABC transporter ATP-binding protein [Candidatus Aerophobetes bacterium]
MDRIIVENLRKSFKRRMVVKGVSFWIERGEVVGLLGPNGAGKTTTFYMIVGFISADAGRILFNSTDITRMPMFKRARLGIGYLPQESSVFRKLTIEQNILAVLENTKLSRKERRERTNRLLEELGVNHVRKQKAYTLSGGERRRTEIARALALEPKFLLLDEPFAGIDPIAVFDIQEIISDLREKGLGILITDHNVRETLKITDRAYIMNEGEILVSGSSEELINNEEAKRIYLGLNFTM